MFRNRASQNHRWIKKSSLSNCRNPCSDTSVFSGWTGMMAVLVVKLRFWAISHGKACYLGVPYVHTDHVSLGEVIPKLTSVRVISVIFCGFCHLTHHGTAPCCQKFIVEPLFDMCCFLLHVGFPLYIYIYHSTLVYH